MHDNKGDFFEEYQIDKKVFARFLVHSAALAPQYLINLIHSENQWDIDALRDVFSKIEQKEVKQFLETMIDTYASDSDQFDLGHYIANLNQVFPNLDTLLKEIFAKAFTKQQAIFKEMLGSYKYFEENHDFIDQTQTANIHNELDKAIENQYEYDDYFNASFDFYQEILFNSPEKITAADLSLLCKAFTRDISPKEFDEVDFGISGHQPLIEFDIFNQVDPDALEESLKLIMKTFKGKKLDQVSKNELFTIFQNILTAYFSHPQQNANRMEDLIEYLAFIDNGKAQELFLEKIEQDRSKDIIEFFPFEALDLMMANILHKGERAVEGKLRRSLTSENRHLSIPNEEGIEEEKHLPLAYLVIKDAFKDAEKYEKDKPKNTTLSRHLANPDITDLKAWFQALKETHNALRELNTETLAKEGEDKFHLLEYEDLEEWDFVEVLSRHCLSLQDFTETTMAEKLKAFLNSYTQEDLELFAKKKTIEFFNQMNV